MKTVKDIEKEYEGFQIKSNFIKSCEDLVAFLLVGIDDTYEIEKFNKKEILYNKFAQLETRIKNFIFLIFDMEEIDLFDEDNELLEESNKLVENYRETCERVIDVANDENYLELIKLIDFCTEYYNKHIDYFEFERDVLEMSLKGISMYNPKYEDNRKVVEEFVDKKLSVYTNNKQLVKKV